MAFKLTDIYGIEYDTCVESIDNWPSPGCYSQKVYRKKIGKRLHLETIVINNKSMFHMALIRKGYFFNQTDVCVINFGFGNEIMNSFGRFDKLIDIAPPKLKKDILGYGGDGISKIWAIKNKKIPWLERTFLRLLGLYVK